MKLILITGGIGSGKSIVSRILLSMGYNVYDCDSRAKSLMDSDQHIKTTIAHDICAAAITARGTIDRRVLASVVFSDNNALQRLNALVHESVRNDIKLWASQLQTSVAWIETAIPRESGLLDIADAEWQVYAPIELRIDRVMARNAFTRQQVLNRIKSQQSSTTPTNDKPVSIIVNDDVRPVLPQIMNLLALE